MKTKIKSGKEKEIKQSKREWLEQNKPSRPTIKPNTGTQTRSQTKTTEAHGRLSDQQYKDEK